MYHQFNIQQFYVMCFVWISEQWAIISLYNINWLVFITETECVYCAVRTGYTTVIQVSLSCKGLTTLLHWTQNPKALKVFQLAL